MMVASVLGQMIGSTIVLGCLYALVGVGFVVLFRSTGVVNFGQSALMVLGAYLVYLFMTQLGMPMWLSLLLAALSVAVIGALSYVGLFHRMVGADLFVTVIATMGLSVVLQMVVFLIWGAAVRNVEGLPSVAPVVQILGVPFSFVDLIAILLSAVLIVALELGLKYTSLGIQTRAVADSTHLSALFGVRVHAVSALAWAVSALCAGVAGGVLAFRVGAVDPVTIGQLGLLVFPVVIIGGVDSIRGALVGAFVVAALQNLASYFIGGNWVMPIAYAALLLMLLIRPRGLFGTTAVARI